MYAAHHAVPLLLRQDVLVAAGLADAAEVEPGLEVGQRVEDVRQQEVEQAPQLAQIVLQRRPCACGAATELNMALHSPQQHAK